MGGRPANAAESVDRALVVLLIFEDRDSLNSREAAELLGVTRSSAYRLLSLLEHRGFVRQDPCTKAFQRGPALGRVGRAAVRRSANRVNLHPLLERVVGKVDETAHLVAVNEGQAFFLDCVEGTKMVRAISRVGESVPASQTADGRLLLAGEVGLRSVAVLVPASADPRDIDLAVSVSGPADRLDDRRLGEIAAVLLDCVSG